MAENINIKVLIDAASAAKTVGDTRKALKDLRSAALQVEDGSDAFKQLTRAAGELQDKMGDLTAEVKYFAEGNPLIRNAQGMVEVMNGVGAAFNLAQGALALFGSENAQLEAVMQKMVIVMGIMNGLKEVSLLLDEKSNAVLFIQNGLKSTAIALAGEEAVALAAEAVAAGTATIAQRALNAAMNANPILALVGLIATATAALFAFTGETEKSTKKEKEAAKASEERAKAIEDEKNAFNDFVSKEASGYIQLADQLKRTNPGSKERLDLINQINSTYGTTLKNLSSEKDFQEQVNTSVDRYIQFLRTKYMLQASQKDQEASFKRQAEFERQLTDAQIKRGLVEAQLNAKRNTAYRDINIANTPEGIQMKQIDDAIGSLEKKRDYEVAVQKAALENAYRYGKQISDSGLKLASDSVKTEKDKNDKIIKEKKEFVADYTKLDEEILNNNKDIADQISSIWGDTYEQQVSNLAASLSEQKALLESEYKDALSEIETQFEEWRKSDAISAEIKTGGWDLARQMKEFDAAFPAFAQKRTLLQSQLNLKLQLLEEQNNKALEDLRKKHEDNIKAITESANQALLASPGYNRYLEYITLQNNQAQEKIALKNAQTIEKNNKQLYDSIKVYEYYQKSIAKIAKDENLQLQTDAEGALYISSEFINSLGEDVASNVVNDYNLAITKTGEFKEELKKLAQSYANVGTTIQEQLKKITLPIQYQGDEGNKDALLALTEKQKESIADIIKTMPELSDKISSTMTKLAGGSDSANKKMAEYIGTLQRLGSISEKESLSILAFSSSIEEMKGKAYDFAPNEKDLEKIFVENNKIQAYLPAVFKNVFALTRELTGQEAGENKLLVAAYKDKLNILKKGEETIAAEILKINEAAQKASEARVAAQQTVLANAMKGTDKKAISDAEAELKRLQAETAKIIEDSSKSKGFKFFPTEEEQKAGIMSFSEAVQKYPELLGKITDITEKRYDELKRISQEFYDREAFDLFMKLKKGEITEDEYNKQLEKMKINHEENMIAIDVVYGKKSQAALEDSEKKKTDIIKAEEQKRKANKEQAIQEAITLEQQLQQLTLQLFQNAADGRISAITEEYNARIEGINAEKEAWEDSLKDRTVAQIQEDEKRKAYEQRIKQEEEARDLQIREQKKNQFEKQKAMDVATAIINGAVAFTKALATLGPYAVLIQGLIAAQTAAQVAIIASQQPAFAEGGLVMGPGGPKDDKINAKLSNGESVINAKSTKQFAPLLSAINQAGGGKPIPSPAGGAMAAGGGGMPVEYIGQRAMAVDNSDVVAAIERLNERPIETYVKESSITSAQNTRRKEDRRSSY